MHPSTLPQRRQRQRDDARPCAINDTAPTPVRCCASPRVAHTLTIPQTAPTSVRIRYIASATALAATITPAPARHPWPSASITGIIISSINPSPRHWQSTPAPKWRRHCYWRQQAVVAGSVDSAVVVAFDIGCHSDRNCASLPPSPASASRSPSCADVRRIDISSNLAIAPLHASSTTAPTLALHQRQPATTVTMHVSSNTALVLPNFPASACFSAVSTHSSAGTAVAPLTSLVARFALDWLPRLALVLALTVLSSLHSCARSSARTHFFADTGTRALLRSCLCSHCCATHYHPCATTLSRAHRRHVLNTSGKTLTPTR